MTAWMLSPASAMLIADILLLVARIQNSPRRIEPAVAAVPTPVPIAISVQPVGVAIVSFDVVMARMPTSPVW